MRLRLVAAVCLGTVGVLFGFDLMTRPCRVHAEMNGNLPTYTGNGKMVAPANYRQWVYLSTGFDMAYTERKNGVPEHQMFDNVFVNPEAYTSFLATGTWPDKTVMVLEQRGAQAKGEVLLKDGRFQGTDVEGLEIHVKDSARFTRPGVGGQWGFYDIGKDGMGKLFEPKANCYSCHAEHAAVDTTFIQFYPTLRPIAEAKKTLSEAYRKEQAGVTGH